MGRSVRREALREPDIRVLALAVATTFAALAGPVPPATAGYTNFEVGHVHPVALTPDGTRLLAVNTPDALLEVFAVQPDGSLVPATTVPVGLEPVTVTVRDDGEAWVVNQLSDTVSVVDLATGGVVSTLQVGNEPTDVAFAGGRAFVAVSEEDGVDVFTLSDLGAGPTRVALAGRDIRALAVSNDGQTVYAVPLKSGNRTTVVNANVAHFNDDNADGTRLGALGLRGLGCLPSKPAFPPLPPGVQRNPLLTDPLDGVPKVGLIVRWNDATSAWEDDAGTSWNDCISYTLADHDLFRIAVSDLAVATVDHLGTSIFDVSVNPGDGTVWLPHTEARNHVRFEPRLSGHVVDNRIAVVDPADGHGSLQIDLNLHVDRDSDPATNQAERLASISQPGQLVWSSDGSVGYLAGFGSRKVFRVNGACASGDCIFTAEGSPPARAMPDAVEVGEGPSGVALLESESLQRLYVLNRISHSISIVDPLALTELAEIPLHDPSSQATRDGRRFLYDAIDGSGHGDASCASCHLFGDNDGLAWDLGDPGGSLAGYDEEMDNVRFITLGGSACDPLGDPNCSIHDGFDPQKGPMTTQTLRGMLEPLHWRGDRATMNDFNAAFVSLMGTADVGTTGDSAGLSAPDMELFRQFALAIRFPPNPYREVDDTLPCGRRGTPDDCERTPHGSLFPGNPAEGEHLFDNGTTDGGGPCVACHTHPFGAAGGQLGGVAPAEPTAPAAAALFNGVGDQSLHHDLKVPHLRNMYEKFGPVLADPGDVSMPATQNGYGFGHDGSVPDLFRFFSISVFSLSAADTAQQVRDVATFMFYFPTGTRPAVGRSLTLPPGTPPPPGSSPEEELLATLVGLGDLADGGRHCELTASARHSGRMRRFHLAGGLWLGDLAGEAGRTTTELREEAQGPITFLCAPPGSGPRLGGDRDEDLSLDGDDCAPGDAATWSAPPALAGLLADAAEQWSWDDPSATTGPSLRYEVYGGTLADLRATGPVAATACVESDLAAPGWSDPRGDPAPGDGYYYLPRGANPCGPGGFGDGREALEALVCSP
jgi:YVTN family beta-propeller protein